MAVVRYDLTMSRRNIGDQRAPKRKEGPLPSVPRPEGAPGATSCVDTSKGKAIGESPLRKAFSAWQLRKALLRWPW